MKKFAISAFLSIVFLFSYPALTETFTSTNRQMPVPTFFMPQSELAPRYEKLPQIRPIYNTQAAPNNKQITPQAPVYKKAKRYIAVDGRYIPVIEDDDNDTEEENASLEYEESDKDYSDDDASIEESSENQETIESDVIDTQDSIAPKENSSEATNQYGVSDEVLTIKEPAHNDNANIKKMVKMPNIEPVNPNAPAYRNRYNEYLTSLQAFDRTKTMPHNQNLETTLEKLNSHNNTFIFKGIVQPDL